MAQTHIAIFPLPVRAHVFPVLGMCRELVRRGFRVTMVVDELHAPLVKQTGAEPVVLQLPKYDQQAAGGFQLPQTAEQWWTAIAKVFSPGLIATAAATISQVESFYDEHRPDLVLYDRGAYAGRVIAHRHTVPTGQVNVHFALQEDGVHWDQGVCRNPAPMMEFGQMLDGFLARYGIARTGNLWRFEDLNIHCVPRAFQYHAGRFDDRFCFVGPCLDRPFERRWRNPGDGKPIILVADTTSSPDMSYARKMVEALSDPNYHVILSVDSHVPDSALGNIPSHFEINREASHLEIFPYADLLVAQGGMGSTLEAIYHGVPVLALPLYPGHEEVAYRVAELGLGVKLPRQTVTVETLRETVRTMIDDKILQHRVVEMQGIFKGAGGAPRAADRIERFLGRRQAA